MSRVLVTGGAGFIGSHLIDRLVEQGDDVICVDNFYTGRKQNLEKWLLLEVIRHDVCFPLYVEVDRIVNLACPASPKWYQRDPVQTMKTSVHGAINLLGLAKRTGARILQASTSEVYGDPEVHPQPETYVGHVNPIGNRSCYDEGKRAAETLFFDYRRQHGVDARVVRIFNTYGPRMAEDDGRVVSNFIVRALRGEPLVIHGRGGVQTRSFCYVDDLVDGLLRAMDADELWGPVNLGNPEEISVSELAGKILALTGSDSHVDSDEALVDDPKRRKPDISRAGALLDWEPKVGLDEGLRKTILYFIGRLGSCPGVGGHGAH